MRVAGIPRRDVFGHIGEVREEVRACGGIVLINPLVYVSEGMRAALTPAVPHMPLGAMLAALVAISVLFLWLGLRAFDRRAIS